MKKILLGLVVLFTLWPVPSYAACSSISNTWSVCTSASAASSNDTSVAITFDDSGSTLGILQVSSFITGGIGYTITDSKSNTFTCLGASDYMGQVATQTCYVINPTVGASHTITITCTGGSCFPAVAYAGYVSSSGTPIFSGVVNTNESANSSATSLTTGSATPDASSSLIVAGLLTNIAATVAIDSSFNLREQADDAAHSYHVALADITQGSPSAVSPTWSWTGGAAASANIAVFDSPPVCSGASKLLFISYPSSVQVGSLFGTTQLGVYDSSNVLCQNDTSTVTLSSHSGSTASTFQSATSLSKAAVGGLVTWNDLSVTPTVGSLSIDAADGVLTGATSGTITITATPTTPWAGILDSSRAQDWIASNAGVTGGIPTRTTICATLSPRGGGPFSDTTPIMNAITACPDNQVVLLTPGTFQMSAFYITRSNVTLRGAGPNLTIFDFTGSGAQSCDGHVAIICVQGFSAVEDPPSAGSATISWTGGYAQGTTVITLATTANLIVGQHLILSQINDSADTGGITVNDTPGNGSIESACGDSGGGSPEIGYCTSELTTITNISGSTVTISPGVYFTHIRSANTPRVWYVGTPQAPSTGVGIEGISINNVPAGSAVSDYAIVSFHHNTNSWARNMRTLNGPRDHYQLWFATHITIEDSYLYGTINSMSQSYGVEAWMSSDPLVQNNIFQHITSPIMQGLNTGGVFAYNYGTDNFYNIADFLQTSFFGDHNAGTGFKLLEGNDGAQILWDTFHGSGGGSDTVFRSYINGWETGKTQGTVPIADWYHNRAENIIGSVLGQPGYHTTYQNTASDGSAIYNLGLKGWSSGGSDPTLVSSLMRWGNYDVVNNAVQWNSAEVPTSGITYVNGNAVPASHTLPASFYLSSQPSWWATAWGAPPWPAIGPDVTGGNITAGSGGSSALGGHANKIPARLCFEHTGADGANPWLLFNANNCYGTPLLPHATRMRLRR